MRRASQIALCSMLMIVAFGKTGSCDEEPVKPAPAKELPTNAVPLIQLLGADQFSVRENATEELIKIGLPARDALEQGRGNADREIRYRCERILLVIYEIDFRRRLEAFSASRDPEQDFELPGWHRFRERMDADANSRALFVLMLKEESTALKSIQGDAKETTDFLDLRTQQLMQSKRLLRQPLPLGSIAAMLFLAGDEKVTLSPQTSSSIYSLCYEQSFRTAMVEGQHRQMMRRLLGAWIRRGEDWTAYQGLALAMQYEIPDGLVAAKRALKDQGPSHIRQYAILALAKLGSAEHIALLEPLLQDKTRTSSRRVSKVTYETQIRDVALAAITTVPLSVT